MLAKKGQIGDTLTWVVATIVIVVVLIFFIFGASMFGKAKNIGGFKASVFSEDIEMRNNVFLQKTVFTYLLNEGENARRKMVAEIQGNSGGEGIIPGNKTLNDIRRNYDLK